MHEFRFRSESLYCEDSRISDVAAQFSTPSFVYSAQTISDHYDKAQTAFAGHPTTICYSVKANSNLHILSQLAGKGAGADIVSGGELFRALRAGIPADKIVYSGVGKTNEEIKYALESEIRFFNVESIPELHRISQEAQRIGKTGRICIRVNPDIDAGTHHHTTTGKKENKFGLSIDESMAHYQLASTLPGIEIVGMDVHLGSPILDVTPYTRALQRLSTAIEELRKRGIPLKVLDLGGGWGIIYSKEDPFSADTFAKAVIPHASAMNLDLIVEPGRFIVGNAGILVTRVIYVKKTPAKNFVIVDAGMNDLIRPPLYDGYHEIVTAENVNRPAMVADVVGPICESADYLGKDREIPEVEPGDLLAVMSAGAYGFAMASNYNSRPRACEVMVEGSSCRVIRKRETYEDLIRGEDDFDTVKTS